MTSPRSFPATIVHWRDGDSVDLSVDLGFKVRLDLAVRVDGIDTPERGRPGHDEAWALARRLAPEGSEVTLVSIARDTEKWGRWVGQIISRSVDVGGEILARGLAVEYHGGTKPVPSIPPGVPAASPGATAGAEGGTAGPR